MRIATFFQPIRDNENLDMETTITIPDQSLSVKEILMRFRRGQIDIPEIDYGPDEDIDSDESYDDISEALDSLNTSGEIIRSESLKAKSLELEEAQRVERPSETNELTKTEAVE